MPVGRPDGRNDLRSKHASQTYGAGVAEPQSPSPGRERPAADRAYDLTKELVLSGGLPGGHLFSEGDIAARLGLSRTPVREAFLRLEAEELLTLGPNRGAIVVPVPPNEAEDVLDARKVVESAAVRRLLRGPGRLPEAIASLRAALVVQRRAAERGDLRPFAEADEASTGQSCPPAATRSWGASTRGWQTVSGA
jgi:DNA-binding GntR family transcriptional regulator